MGVQQAQPSADAGTILASSRRETVADILPGQLIHIFFVSIFDAALLSWLALLWYRRSVDRLMREVDPATDAPRLEAGPRSLRAAVTAPDGATGFLLAEEQAGAATGTRVGRPGLGRAVLAYSCGAAAYAAVITILKFWPESPPPLAVAWLVGWWANGWAIVPTLVALLVLDRRSSLRVMLLYIIGGAIGIALFTTVGQVSRGTLNSAPLTNVFWAMATLAWTALAPLAVLSLTSWRRVRAVLPIALAGTILFGFGSLLATELFVRLFDVEAIRSLLLDAAFISSASAVRYLFFMFLSLPVGWIAWRVLIGLASGYSRKRFSDVQLAIDCWWTVVTASDTVSLTTSYGLAGIAWGVVAFVAYRLAVMIVLRGPRHPAGAPRRLLLLRVFGYQARTESLFDRVAQMWRFHGPVQLIAGVDLAMRTVDPGDVLTLLDGRLAELYVRAPEEIGERLDRLDLGPDPDGRFRINEVYCHANTWRATLAALIGTSDAVLMDLRSFSAGNAGCIFELEQLVQRLPTDHIVLVCDNTTDLPLLRQILSDAWTAARDSGHARGASRLAVVRVERNSPAELGLVMQCLLRMPARSALSL
jgi:hypothetical protein